MFDILCKLMIYDTKNLPSPKLK